MGVPQTQRLGEGVEVGEGSMKTGRKDEGGVGWGRWEAGGPLPCPSFSRPSRLAPHPHQLSAAPVSLGAARRKHP